jgi:hypothetical protein
MIEDFTFSDFLGIFFVAMPIFIFVLSAVFLGVTSIFETLSPPARERPKVVLHYHYRDRR